MQRARAAHASPAVRHRGARRCPARPQVCYLLRQCLDMRGRWLFRPALSLEQLSELPEAVTVTDANGDPFVWQPQVGLRAGADGAVGKRVLGRMIGDLVTG